MAVKNLDTYRKDPHKLRSTRMVFLGILDFSNGEGEPIDGDKIMERTVLGVSELVGVRSSLTAICRSRGSLLNFQLLNSKLNFSAAHWQLPWQRTCHPRIPQIIGRIGDLRAQRSAASCSEGARCSLDVESVVGLPLC